MTPTSTAVLRTTVLLVASALVLTACTPAPEPTEPPVERDPLSLAVGALLPQTGSLAQFGPSAQAGVDLAVQEINEAGLGITVTSESRDSADATTDTAVASVAELIALPVSVIVGPISDNVSRKVIDQVVDAGIVQISPGNVSLDFTRYDDDDLYWRTSPSCTLEGDALGRRIAEDGVQSIGIIYQEGYCEPGLPEALSAAFERAGGDVVASSSFAAGAGDLSGQVSEVVAAAPDAVVMLTNSASQLAVPGLQSAGFTGDQLYFVGLGLGDHSADFPAGSLTGSLATQPGLDISTLKAFTDRLLTINPALTDFSYAAEAYDAVTLAALAALAANDTTGAGIASALQEVSGGSGAGMPVREFAEGAQLILDGEVIDYDGPSGAITFDDAGDPQGAVIGLYRYGADNTYTRVD